MCGVSECSFHQVTVQPSHMSCQVLQPDPDTGLLTARDTLTRDSVLEYQVQGHWSACKVRGLIQYLLVT